MRRTHLCGRYAVPVEQSFGKIRETLSVVMAWRDRSSVGANGVDMWDAMG